MGFANTKAALAVFDAGQAARDAAFAAASTEVEISQCVIDEVIAEEKVQDAYFQDTGFMNTREHCRLVKVDDHLRKLCAGEFMLLDCGHSIDAPQPGHVGGTGYANSDEGRICYACANAKHREWMKNATSTVTYLHGAQGTLTDWPGLKLASVEGRIKKTKQTTPVGGRWELWTFRARDLDGGLWSCRGTGLGMVVHMRRMKDGAK